MGAGRGRFVGDGAEAIPHSRRVAGRLASTSAETSTGHQVVVQGDPDVLACFRVPIRLEVEVSVWVANGKTGKRHSYTEHRRKLNSALWGPIVAARNSAEAIEKATNLFPDGEIGKPTQLCEHGTHTPGRYPPMTTDRLLEIGYR